MQSGAGDSLIQAFKPTIMIKIPRLAAASCLVFLSLQAPGRASEVLDRIQETGVIRAGTRTDSIPFAYIDDRGEWVGYSVDMLELIRQQVERELQQPIRLELVEVSPQDRFEKIDNGDIDLECGSTTYTWERERLVDFSVSYFMSGTQMLVAQDSSLDTIDSLQDRAIGVVPQTTNEAILRSLQPEADYIAVDDRFDGLRRLEAGEIEGFASDGILLAGLRQAASNPNDWEIVPEQPYLVESYACILPENQSRWRDLVNYTLVNFMQGIVSDDLETVAIYNRWFGTDGVTPYSREMINDYFLSVIYSLEWISE